MTNKSPIDLIKKGLSNPRGVIEYLIPRSTLSGIELALFSRMPVGENVLEDDWDLLIVLDTCRVDALTEIQRSATFPWLNDLEIASRRSIGGSTLEWTAQTFRDETRDLVSDIDYIAGNMIVEDVLAGNQNPEDSSNASWSPTAWRTLSKGDFNEFVSVWEQRETNGPSQGHANRPHPSAETVTDVAITHGRENDPDRTVVHYIQPHYPYYAAASAESDELASWERYPFPSLMAGDISREAVWDRYIRELESAATSIETLLENFDADRVAITSDHGEAFGEWLGYKHRGGTLHPHVRRVPWAETTATDTRSYEPDIDVETTDMGREEMLEALGYL